MAAITVGFPVYNGAERIVAALDTILDGDFRDIVVIVSDNCSTDGTPELVEEVAQRDPRVQLIRQKDNLGAVGNFVFLAQQAETPYFMWRADDDYSDANYLSALYEHLQRNPDACLVAPAVETRKKKGAKARPFSIRLKTGQYADMSNIGQVQAAWVYGLFETNFARNAFQFTHENYPHLFGCDMVVLLDAMLTGRVTGTNEAVFVQNNLKPPLEKNQQPSGRTLRKIFRDFIITGNKLGDKHNLSSFQKFVFKFRLYRYAFKRVVRLPKLLKP